MDTIFMKSENCKKSDPYILLLNLSDKINLKRINKYVALSNLRIYYTWKNKFKISPPTWIKKIELPDGSYSVSDIQDYFKYIIKKHKIVTDNLPIKMYVNKTENRMTFQIKRGYYLQLLTSEMMKLLGSTKNKITKDEDGENIPCSETTEVVLVHCNIVKNDYKEDSRVLFTIVPNKSLGQLLDISPKYYIFLKAFNSEFSYIEAWFTDQNSNPMQIK